MIDKYLIVLERAVDKIIGCFQRAETSLLPIAQFKEQNPGPYFGHFAQEILVGLAYVIPLGMTATVFFLIEIDCILACALDLSKSDTSIAGGPPEAGKFQEDFQVLPLAATLPDPRAKRIVLNIPNAKAATKTLTVTTDTGTTHNITLTKTGNTYQSEALFFEVGATGSRALGGFPVKYEIPGGTQGSGDDGDIPVTVVEDVGGEAQLSFVDANGERLRDIVIRRLPNGTTEPGAQVITNSTKIAGLKLRIDPVWTNTNYAEAWRRVQVAIDLIFQGKGSAGDMMASARAEVDAILAKPERAA